MQDGGLRDAYSDPRPPHHVQYPFDVAVSSPRRRQNQQQQQQQYPSYSYDDAASPSLASPRAHNNELSSIRRSAGEDLSTHSDYIERRTRELLDEFHTNLNVPFGDRAGGAPNAQDKHAARVANMTPSSAHDRIPPIMTPPPPQALMREQLEKVHRRRMARMSHIISQEPSTEGYGSPPRVGGVRGSLRGASAGLDVAGCYGDAGEVLSSTQRSLMRSSSMKLSHWRNTYHALMSTQDAETETDPALSGIVVSETVFEDMPCTEVLDVVEEVVVALLGVRLRVGDLTVTDVLSSDSSLEVGDRLLQIDRYRMYNVVDVQLTMVLLMNTDAAENVEAHENTVTRSNISVVVSREKKNLAHTTSTSLVYVSLPSEVEVQRRRHELYAMTLPVECLRSSLRRLCPHTTDASTFTVQEAPQATPWQLMALEKELEELRNEKNASEERVKANEEALERANEVRREQLSVENLWQQQLQQERSARERAEQELDALRSLSAEQDQKVKQMEKELVSLSMRLMNFPKVQKKAQDLEDKVKELEEALESEQKTSKRLQRVIDMTQSFTVITAETESQTHERTSERVLKDVGRTLPDLHARRERLKKKGDDVSATTTIKEPASNPISIDHHTLEGCVVVVPTMNLGTVEQEIQTDVHYKDLEHAVRMEKCRENGNDAQEDDLMSVRKAMRLHDVFYRGVSIASLNEADLAWEQPKALATRPQAQPSSAARWVMPNTPAAAAAPVVGYSELPVVDEIESETDLEATATIPHHPPKSKNAATTSPSSTLRASMRGRSPSSSSKINSKKAKSGGGGVVVRSSSSSSAQNNTTEEQPQQPHTLLQRTPTSSSSSCARCDDLRRTVLRLSAEVGASKDATTHATLRGLDASVSPLGRHAMHLLRYTATTRTEVRSLLESLGDDDVKLIWLSLCSDPEDVFLKRYATPTISQKQQQQQLTVAHFACWVRGDGMRCKTLSETVQKQCRHCVEQWLEDGAISLAVNQQQQQRQQQQQQQDLEVTPTLNNSLCLGSTLQQQQQSVNNASITSTAMWMVT
eukprot:PhM_4_TR18602/c0_g1_i1/m.87730